MPENDIMRIQIIYALIEKLGVERHEEGVKYVAFMTRRMLGNQYENVNSLCVSAAQNFNTTSETVRDKVFEVQLKVHDYLTGPSAKFNPMLRDVMHTAFCDNEYNIKNTEQFLKGIVKMVKE